MATDGLKAHHIKLRDLAGQILSAAKQPALAASGGAVRDLLTRMAGIVSVHLAAEDNSFYPRLLSDKRREVSEIAARFQQEMGGIKEAFGQYVKQWTRDAIAADPTGFAQDTATVLSKLGSRMDREERELYPLDV
jgi:hypothetical protein